MLTTVEGVYRDGRVELKEMPGGALPDRTQVLVTFLEGHRGRDQARPDMDDELAEIGAICEHCQALPDLDVRSPAEILDYDERGLP